jgi:hypothetical protein
MSKSTNTNTNASKIADLREELARSQDRIDELESQLAAASASGSGDSGIAIANYAKPGDFAKLSLPDAFFNHATREALHAASLAANASDKLSAADVMLGFWRWMADDDGLKPQLAREIGKSHGISNPIGETLGFIRKAEKAFGGKFKMSPEKRANAAEAKAAALEAKLNALLASGKFDDLL